MEDYQAREIKVKKSTIFGAFLFPLTVLAIIVLTIPVWILPYLLFKAIIKKEVRLENPGGSP